MEKTIAIVPSLLLLLILAAAGCRTVPMFPANVESSFFYTLESGFRISAREGAVRYVLTLEPKIPLDEPLFLRVLFQNPADAEAPLVVEQWTDPHDLYVFLESPPLSRLQAEIIYRIEIEIFSYPEETDPLDQHIVFIRSTITTRW
jgi:hypothetical protein